MRIGIIGGSGTGERLRKRLSTVDVRAVRPETPFGPPSSEVILAAHTGGADVALLERHGPGHRFAPADVPYRANIYALKSLGVTHIIATGAVGSLREHIAPGEAVLIDQFIDRTSVRPRTFFERSAVHVEFDEPVCPVMREWIGAAADQAPGQTKLHRSGCYVCIEGPSFSTAAESQLHRQWGADVVGMTALPEARLAREAEMAYALLALPTDYDCWRVRDRSVDADSLLGEIIQNLGRASDTAFTLIDAVLQDVSFLESTPSLAHRALDRAIWTARDQLDPMEVESLRPIWGRVVR